MPKISKDEQIILLDPTIATGGSAITALNILKEYVPEGNIIFVAVLTSSEGLKNIKEKFKNIKIILVEEDQLNDKNLLYQVLEILVIDILEQKINIILLIY